MTSAFDVLGIGNAIVDVISRADDAFLAKHTLTKGSMMLIDEARADTLYGAMGPGIEVSGGLGPLVGKLRRIGVMGAGARPEPQEALVRAVAELLKADPEEPMAALAQGWQA